VKRSSYDDIVDFVTFAVSSFILTERDVFWQCWH